MDLNYLFHQHQLAVARSAVAASDVARKSHQQLAEGYAICIRSAQQRLGARSFKLGVAH